MRGKCQDRTTVVGKSNSAEGVGRLTTVAGLGRFSKEAIRLRCLSLTVKGAVTKNTQLLREYSQAASHG